MRKRSGPTQNFPDYTDLIEKYGPPLRRTLVLRRPKSPDSRFSYPFNRKRPGEIVLVIPRPPRAVLVHTKSFYPPDLFRLPTGGLKGGEELSVAIHRELHEETGFKLGILQFLFHLEVRMIESTRQRRFHSFGFLLEPTSAAPSIQDTDERITGFNDLPLEELKGMAHRLRRLPSPWSLWGRFRAKPHIMTLRTLEEREAMKKPIWILPSHDPGSERPSEGSRES
ncbi:MAG: NUDIX domain-containing protein [Candidatus Eisenbacteria bacterium]|uniref:NUDIX domain-containing protein n=1 Tax=Eiseniibacteriota bacterium TaxID=2212470 RepID=A0A948RT28_UNCEI|nr:NUDIX domain-containing protein [Candidatus Eisenbacteria bacterium]MBU1949174.1 NUDIX domain-containing protein [Candidatus Eisenbacteria bacterium]MBU2690498.1 NUDIX domain-containing protein [Candidatus Eisenbacteria bacterium]